ncbi:cleavage induced hypothetical protein [Thraustotheca clavata]|uniref:Disease resistance R13L4/SHOC-2-like LRR domain-containing protein n=1 Tax=Thraustotheca clavata TaxID=74557 RepID=A0A1V9ZRV4_9STRA|nr:cleavage induced hypothetical protein [Thraustotheca clavata]
MANKFPYDQLHGNGILFHPIQEDEERIAGLKAPVVNIHKEYAASGSYAKTRETIRDVVQQHKGKVLSNNERHIREQQAEKYRTRFLETRLATTGPPTLNTLSVMIDHQKKHADELTEKDLNDPKIAKEEAMRSIKTAMYRSYGSGKLDLKAQHIDVMPEAIFTTFLLQMARFIKEINISRNEFREISSTFCDSFPGCELLNASENSLNSISREIGAWDDLHTLNLDCNKLDLLPDTLPCSIINFSASRNRIAEVPYIYRLNRLATLDLSHNLLHLLPNALFELTFLRQLNCSKNKIISMALIPIPSFQRRHSFVLEETSHENTTKKDWTVQIDPITKENIYFNNKTKQVTRKRPQVLDSETKPSIPKLQLNGNTNKKEYPGGWEIIPGQRASYRNHSTEETWTCIPPELDRYDRLVHMKKLNLSNNEIDELPASVGQMHSLEYLSIGHNRLYTLPAALCDLTNLTCLYAPSNCISTLPQGFVSFPVLKELDLKLNRLSKLPSQIGNLTTLTTLDLSSNNLEYVPGSMIQLHKLVTLSLNGNPLLKVPSANAQMLGVPAVFAEIKNQIFTEKRGEPPKPSQVATGIVDECITTDIHVHRELMTLIENAKSTFVIDFHWRNLTSLPIELFQLSMLQELRLTGHNFKEVPPEIALLSSLRLLNLRQNHIKVLDPSCVGVNCQWEEFDIENNELVLLPDTLVNASKLRILRLGCNFLETLPPSLDKLQELQMLHAPHNHLLALPDDLSRAPLLKVIDVSNNRIRQLDTFDFDTLTHLVEFKANRNFLSTLPPSIAQATIQDLSLSGNQIEEFPMVACKMKFIKRLWMQSNRLLELPVEFGELQTLEMVEFEGNPLRSPPPTILSQGIVEIQIYLQKRLGRVEELKKLLAAVPYGFHVDHIIPRTRNLLVSNIEFLHPEDIEAFENQVDQYVNGSFFEWPDTRGVDLVEQLRAKQFERAQNARKAVLDNVLALCKLIQHKRWLDKVDFRYDLTRPWGYNAEQVQCFMINPIALYEDWEDVPSILSVIEKRVGRGFKEEAFIHSREVVADALNNFKGVYGPIGLAHDRIPFRCGCEEMIRKGTKHDPCYKYGWTIVYAIVTHEEAARRVKEEEQITNALKQVREEIETFLTTTRNGKARLFKEAKKLKKERRDRKKRIKKQLPSLKKAVVLRKDDLKIAEQKKVLDKIIAGEAWDEMAESDADKAIKDIVDDIAVQEEYIQDMEKIVVQLKHELRQKFNHYVTEIVDLLLGTTGKEIRERIVLNQRVKAVRKRYRRPWDLEFEKFKAKYLDMPAPPSPRDNSEISEISDSDYEDDISGVSSVVSDKEENANDPEPADESEDSDL